jgi:hypothetical protein
MPVSYSFRPAWDARRKMDEVRPAHIPSPQPVPPPKLPKAPLSLSHLSFPSFNSNCSAPTVPPPITSNTFFSPIASNSRTHSSSFVSSVPARNDLLDTQTVESPQFSHSCTAAFPNSYHRRFSSTLNSNSSLAPLAMPTTSSRAPRLEFPTHLRPPVLAANRLSSWTTPYAQQQRSDLESKLPLDLVDKAYHVVHSSLAPATRSSYGAGLLRFTQFCDSWRIDEQDRMPASAALLTAFVSQCAGSYSGKTIKSWLAALRSWHIANRAPWNGDDEWVQLARVSGNKQGTAFKRAPRAPVSLDHLRFLRSKLDITTSFHAAVWATALTTFFGCRRLGETTVKSQGEFCPLFHVTRSTSFSFRNLPNGSASASIRIPWTKTTKQEGGTIILTSRNDEFCPVAALRNHLAVNKDAPSSMSFFAYLNSDGSFSHMLREVFAYLTSLIHTNPCAKGLSQVHIINMATITLGSRRRSQLPNWWCRSSTLGRRPTYSSGRHWRMEFTRFPFILASHGGDYSPFYL